MSELLFSLALLAWTAFVFFLGFTIGVDYLREASQKPTASDSSPSAWPPSWPREEEANREHEGGAAF